MFFLHVFGELLERPALFLHQVFGLLEVLHPFLGHIGVRKVHCRVHGCEIVLLQREFHISVVVQQQEGVHAGDHQVGPEVELLVVDEQWVLDVPLGDHLVLEGTGLGLVGDVEGGGRVQEHQALAVVGVPAYFEDPRELRGVLRTHALGEVQALGLLGEVEGLWHQLPGVEAVLAALVSFGVLSHGVRHDVFEV